jgi:hypothetical protein
VTRHTWGTNCDTASKIQQFCCCSTAVICCCILLLYFDEDRPKYTKPMQQFVGYTRRMEDLTVPGLWVWCYFKPRLQSWCLTRHIQVLHRLKSCQCFSSQFDFLLWTKWYERVCTSISRYGCPTYWFHLITLELDWHWLTQWLPYNPLAVINVWCVCNH